MKSFLVPLLGLSLASSLLAVPVGDLGRGIYSKENAAGEGYIMFSPEGFSERFVSISRFQATHFYAVYYAGDQWYYYNNETPIPFTPQPDDVLVATVDYSADSPAVMLAGQNAITNGIVSGYVAGDIEVQVNVFNGASNPGEFGVIGSDITLNPIPDELQVDPPISIADPNDPRAISIGNIGPGVTAAESAAGTGYILFFQEAGDNRFTLHPNQASQLISVYHADDQWYYYKNETPLPFTPSDTDLLVASVNFSLDTQTTMLKGSNYMTNGIATGYMDGDLEILTNRYGGVQNFGEFGVSGTFIIPNASIFYGEATSIGNVASGVLARDNATGAGYVMWSQQDVGVRFQGMNVNQADHFVAVSFVNDQWHYDNNSGLMAFTPEPSDRLVASVNFSDDSKAILLKGEKENINGIASGYLDGNLEVYTDHYANTVNANEFQVRGSDIVLHPGPPSWWGNVIDEDVPATNFAVANVGQLKNMVAHAADHLIDYQHTVPQEVSDMLNAWESSSANNYAAANLGQVKHLSSLFWFYFADNAIDGLKPNGELSPYANDDIPWTTSISDDDNFATANLGQLKNAFSFSAEYGTAPIPDGDYYEGLEYSISITSGDGQTYAPGKVGLFPIVIHVQDEEGNPLVSAPVSVGAMDGIPSGAYSLRPDGSNPRSLHQRLITDSRGNISVWYIAPE